jgi:hypothetical protein
MAEQRVPRSPDTDAAVGPLDDSFSNAIVIYDPEDLKPGIEPQRKSVVSVKIP